jgi:hypothetical protein
MTDPLDSLILDLLQWIGPGARPYSEVIEAWRTSCPRLPVWEEANARGFLSSDKSRAAERTSRCHLSAESIFAQHGQAGRFDERPDPP